MDDVSTEVFLDDEDHPLGEDSVLFTNPSSNSSQNNNSNQQNTSSSSASSSSSSSSSNNTTTNGIFGSCTPSCLTLQYYSHFFDVSTEQILDRIYRSSVPHKLMKPFLLPTPLETPDLYGPFWICTSLVIIATVMANTAEWLAHYISDDSAVHLSLSLSLSSLSLSLVSL